MTANLLQKPITKKRALERWSERCRAPRSWSGEQLVEARRSRRIQTAFEAMIAAGSEALARGYFHEMVREIRARPAAVVAEMERARGLRTAVVQS